MHYFLKPANFLQAQKLQNLQTTKIKNCARLVLTAGRLHIHQGLRAKFLKTLLATLWKHNEIFKSNCQVTLTQHAFRINQIKSVFHTKLTNPFLNSAFSTTQQIVFLKTLTRLYAKNTAITETQILKKIEMLMTEAHRTEKAEIALPLTFWGFAAVFILVVCRFCNF